MAEGSRSAGTSSAPRPPEELVSRLGLPDACAEMFPLALTHRSYAYEQNEPSNERLEFLGDSVLGIAVTEYLFAEHPDNEEGQLAKMRAQVVSTRALASVAREIGLGDYVRLGRGELRTGGADKDSILADTFEAILGATRLTAGMDVARELIVRLLQTRMVEAAALGDDLDPKTSLQELTARYGWGAPRYVVREAGPDHAKSFLAVVLLEIGEFGSGQGTSKKDAEHQAAQSAIVELRERAAEAAVSDGDAPPQTRG